MITGNAVTAQIGPFALVQRLQEELAAYKLRGGTSTVIAAALDKLQQAALVLAEFQQRAEAIQADALLSDAGKQAKMESLVQAYYGKLAFVEQAATDRTRAASELRAELDALPKAPGDPIIEWMRGAEIRQELRKLAQPERMKLVEARMTRTDLSILRAIDANPLGASDLLPTEYLTRLKEQILERNRSEELERWKTLVLCAERLQLLAHVLETSLGRYSLAVPTFETKPTTQTDLKMTDQTASPAKKAAVDTAPATQFV
jgi:hypothetical protein